jgi:hypothetical protein
MEHAPGLERRQTIVKVIHRARSASSPSEFRLSLALSRVNGISPLLHFFPTVFLYTKHTSTHCIINHVVEENQ